MLFRIMIEAVNHLLATNPHLLISILPVVAFPTSLDGMPGMVGFRVGWFGWYGFRGSKSWGLAHKVAQSPEGININKYK